MLAKSTKKVAHGRGQVRPIKRRSFVIAGRVSESTHLLVKEMALRSGRSMADELTAGFERALAYDEMLASMRMSVDDILAGNLTAAHHQRGDVMLRDKNGKRAWFEDGFDLGGLKIPRSGFIPNIPEGEDQ